MKNKSILFALLLVGVNISIYAQKENAFGPRGVVGETLMEAVKSVDGQPQEITSPEDNEISAPKKVSYNEWLANSKGFRRPVFGIKAGSYTRMYDGKTPTFSGWEYECYTDFYLNWQEGREFVRIGMPILGLLNLWLPPKHSVFTYKTRGGEKYQLHTLRIPVSMNYRVPVGNSYGFIMGLGAYFECKTKLKGDASKYSDFEGMHKCGLGFFFSGSFMWKHNVGVSCEYGFGVTNRFRNETENYWAASILLGI